MSASLMLGIDIGSQGAVALLTTAGELLEVADMPILRDGPSRRPNVSAALLADIISKMQAGKAYVEFVGARPGEGAVGAFAFGRSRGVIEGVCAAGRTPYRLPDARLLEADRRDSAWEGWREGRRARRGDSRLAGQGGAVRARPRRRQSRGLLDRDGRARPGRWTMTAHYPPSRIIG